MYITYCLYNIITAPASPPTNVDAVGISSTEVLVTWDSVPPIDQNGIITMYEVLYQPLETFGGAIGPLTRNVSGTEMSVVLTDLQEFINYTISVRAYTSVAEGPYSQEISVSTFEDGKVIIIIYATYNNYHTIVQFLPVRLLILPQLSYHPLRFW